MSDAIKWLSTSDLEALSSGDLSRMSAAGLQRLAGAVESPKPAAADEVGMGKAALIAAGRGTDQLVKGAQQLWYGATGNQQAQDQLAQTQAEETALYQPLKQKFPVATAIGESAPAVAMPVFGGGSTAALLAKGAISGAVPELLRYGSAEERLARGAVGAAGGAAGAGLGLAATRVLKPAGVGVTGASDTAMEAAQRIGYTPTAGQRTQNPAMLNFENYLARSPGSSGGMQALNDANQAAINRAAARSVGVKADDLGEAVLGGAKARLGDEFTRLSAVTKPQLGDDFVNALGTIEAANTAKGPFASKQVTGLIDQGLDLAAKGDLSGVAYKEIRTELGNRAQAAFQGGDATTGKAIKDVMSALDKAAKGSLSAADQKAWDAARAQWANLKVLTKGNVAEGGNVSAARVAAKLRQGGDRFRAGGMSGDLADIGRVGEAFKSVSNPNSGNLTQNMIYGNPITGVPALLGNKAMGAAYRSNLAQKYLGSGLLDIGEVGQLGLTRLGLLGGIPATQSLLGAQ